MILLLDYDTEWVCHKCLNGAAEWRTGHNKNYIKIMFYIKCLTFYAIIQLKLF